MKKYKTIAVTGITGHTGKYFAQELIKNNYKGNVKCLVRESSNTRILDNSNIHFEKIVGDINDEKAINELLSNADILVHIVNIHYSLQLVKAAKDNKVNRIILVHTTGIYSKHKQASEEYKKIERNLEKYINDKNLSITILQPTMIYGDICDHNISKFIKIADKLPVIPEINRGKALIQPVNARDLGKAYYQCAIKNKLPSTHYVVSGKDVITIHELMENICSKLGKKAHFINISPKIAESMAKIIKFISFKKIDLVEKVQRLSEDRTYSNKKSRIDFNYNPESFNKGLEREIKQYRECKNEK